jgi:hypothetical protein
MSGSAGGTIPFSPITSNRALSAINRAPLGFVFFVKRARCRRGGDSLSVVGGHNDARTDLVALVVRAEIDNRAY